ncbi:MAG TPA: histone deacetylase family protein, partial [bacterium]|nr:histone deacetylase family protein [bacterium]
PLFPLEKRAVEQVQKLLFERFTDLEKEKIDALPYQLNNPVKYRFKTILFVADDVSGNVKGFAVLMTDKTLNFCFLDFIATDVTAPSGLGSAIYERVREEALKLESRGIFFECLPDDPVLCKDCSKLKENASRLRFYERFGAFPIADTKYETPLSEEDDSPPYLMFDGLIKGKTLGKRMAKKIVRAILKRKYGDLCSQEYISLVVNSFKDDPVKLRPPRYIKKPKPAVLIENVSKIALLINDRHDIHHIRERGYVESPVRIRSILSELEKTTLFEKFQIEEFPEHFIKDVHDSRLINFLKKVCMEIGNEKSVYPYVFPVRNADKPPEELDVSAGYFCIDTFTPLNKNAWLAARNGVNCALTAARIVLNGQKCAYALLRPPGHHAESKVFGGFCYLNNGAIAANYLSGFGKVAILDIDYHHGNGQQEIFYKRNDVLTVSIHGHPSFSYPYFSGFANEKGEGAGTGFNFNYPLEKNIYGDRYLATLTSALIKIKNFKPSYFVLLLGFDTAKGDPTGSWQLNASDFFNNGKMIGSLKLPTVVIQEGGYKNRSLGINARNFFEGFIKESGDL